ncbi:MAG: ribonuclease J, partial [Candidatus Margulisbacteria bacterium]|nr:ribonuclease J [Candidatus Margulisiibacteriota bacterium]
GSQGEPLSALSRIANDNYRLFQIKPGDTVIVSALPIPGNEKTVYSVIDKLGRKGVQVIYEEASKMHVSGHAYAEELKLILMLFKPKFFIPVHGEYRHLSAHAQLARDLGNTEEIMIAENGDIIQIDKNSIKIIDKLQLHSTYIDSNDMCLDDEQLINIRKNMASDGAVVVVLFIHNELQSIQHIQITTKGVVMDEMPFLKGLQDSIADQYNYLFGKGNVTKETLAQQIEDMVRKYLLKKIDKNPEVIPVIIYK